jgi:hypothetical protein
MGWPLLYNAGADVLAAEKDEAFCTTTITLAQVMSAWIIGQTLVWMLLAVQLPFWA